MGRRGACPPHAMGRGTAKRWRGPVAASRDHNDHSEDTAATTGSRPCPARSSPTGGGGSPHRGETEGGDAPPSPRASSPGARREPPLSSPLAKRRGEGDRPEPAGRRRVKGARSGAAPAAAPSATARGPPPPHAGEERRAPSSSQRKPGARAPGFRVCASLRPE